MKYSVHTGIVTEASVYYDFLILVVGWGYDQEDNTFLVIYLFAGLA
jgi:hypothetical protein